MESSFKILLVDDQQLVLDGLKKQLNWSVLMDSSVATFQMVQKP